MFIYLFVYQLNLNKAGKKLTYSLQDMLSI